MIKITLKRNGTEKTILAPEQKPIRDILSKEGIKLTPFTMVSINQNIIPEEKLGDNLLELGFGTETELTLSITKGLLQELDEPDEQEEPNPFGDSNMQPKAMIIGCACIIFSAFTPDELRDMQHYLPEAMMLRDEQGEPAFAVTLDETASGSLNKYGAVFSKHASAEGKATITIVIDPECDDTEEAVRETLGQAILCLIEAEEQMKSNMSELAKKKQFIQENIQKL